MINAQDNVEKCVTFVLAHLFAFATVNRVFFHFFFKLSFPCCPCTYCHVKYVLKGNEGNI